MSPSVVRGTVVLLSASFVDETGAEVVPSATRVTISFVGPDRQRASESFSATAVGSEMQVEWDSGSALPGPVDYTFVTDDPAIRRIALDGRFEVTANAAHG